MTTVVSTSTDRDAIHQAFQSDGYVLVKGLISPEEARGMRQEVHDVFQQVLGDVAATGVTHVVFGDIMFDEHRRWAERMCEAAGLTAVEPLWGESTHSLFAEWIACGADALIVTARAEYLDASWLGRRLSAGMELDFDRLGVDRCGERGEYHTVVVDTPLFSRPLSLRHGSVVQHGGCWALDVSVGPPDGGHYVGC